MNKTVHGEHADHDDIASSMFVIGLVMQSRGDYTAALQLHRECLAMVQRVYGADASHDDIAQSHHGIGMSLLRQQDDEHALISFRKSLTIMAAVHGPHANHDCIARTRCAMSMVHYYREAFPRAVDEFKASVAMMARVHCGNPFYNGTSLRVLGDLLFRGGTDAAALEQYRANLDMATRLYRKGVHPTTAAALYALGAGLMRCTKTGSGEVPPEQMAKALERFGECVCMTKWIHRNHADHVDIADALFWTGEAQFRAGDLDGSLKTHERCWRMRVRIFQNDGHPDRPELAQSLRSVARVQRDTHLTINQLGQSLAMLRRMYKPLYLSQSNGGGGVIHTAVAAVLHELGTARHCEKKYSGALAEHQASLAMQRQIHGDDADHLDIAGALFSVGHTQFSMRKSAAASETFLAACAMQKRVTAGAVDD